MSACLSRSVCFHARQWIKGLKRFRLSFQVLAPKAIRRLLRIPFGSHSKLVSFRSLCLQRRLEKQPTPRALNIHSHQSQKRQRVCLPAATVELPNSCRKIVVFHGQRKVSALPERRPEIDARRAGARATLSEDVNARKNPHNCTAMWRCARTWIVWRNSWCLRGETSRDNHDSQIGPKRRKLHNFG